MSSSPIKFTRGVPPVESFPTNLLADCMVQVLAEFGNQIQQYAGSLGFQPLRELISVMNQTSPEQVLIGQGSLQILDLAARLLIEPGDKVYVEAPSYDRAVTTLKRVRANVVGIHLEEDGPDFEHLKTRLENGERPKLIYLIPDFQNPSGCLMSVEKRRFILELAQIYGFWIVEDAPYRLLRYRGSDLPTIYSFAPEQVMLMASYSKTICPGLRVGYMLVPKDLIGGLAKTAEDTYINTSYINQATVFDFIRRGWFDEHLIRLKKMYLNRLEKMLASLETHMMGLGDWTKPDGGFFVSLNLSKTPLMETLTRESKIAGLELTDGRGFFANGYGENFIRLPFCGLSPDEIEEGICLLANVIRNV